jgi:hypothetical protein
MASTILSSLSETVLHHNALATVTDSWIVVRDERAHSQSLVLIDSLSKIRALKTLHLAYLTWAAGCILVSIASQYSNDACGLAIPFAMAGFSLLAAARVTRRASISFVLESEVVNTSFGTLREAATLVAAVKFVQEGKRRGRRPSYSQLVWVRAYLALLL